MDVVKQQYIDQQNYILNAFKEHMHELKGQLEDMQIEIVGGIKSGI
jgi:hypothetical protein